MVASYLKIKYSRFALRRIIMTKMSRPQIQQKEECRGSGTCLLDLPTEMLEHLLEVRSRVLSKRDFTKRSYLLLKDKECSVSLTFLTF